MKSEIIHNKNIDRFVWDEFNNSCANGSIFNLSWYLDIVFPQWQALLISDDYGWVAVLPLFPRKKWGFNISLQPLLIRYSGMCRNEPEFDIRKMHEIVNEALSSFSICHFTSSTNFISENEQKNKITYKLNISSSYDQIFGGFKKSLRNKINHFDKHGLTISDDKTASALTELFQHYHEIGKFNVPQDYCQNLELLYAVARQKNMAKIVTVRNVDMEVAASILFFYFGTTVYLFSGLINKEYKVTGIKPYLLAMEIKAIAGKYEKLDFLGSLIPGVATFNESFGAVQYSYAEVIRKRFPFNVLPI
jgi:hypothetical protein